MRVKIISFILLNLFLIVLPVSAQAATLYLKPSQNTYYRNDVFIEEIWLDTQNKEINAGEINLQYTPSLLSVEDISIGDSVFTLWIKQPEIDKKNVISFIGGIPNGFNGKGLIGKIIIKANKEGEAKITFLNNSQILLNDGKGTKAKVNTRQANITILSEDSRAPEDEWETLLRQDTTPPESFQIEIGKDPSIFEGKYFIAFSTVDKGTGIDHYEVKEGEKDWQEANSPYVLHDQTFKSKILVKAIDKAGNERIETLGSGIELSLGTIIWLVFILMNIGGIVFFYFKFKSKGKI